MWTVADYRQTYSPSQLAWFESLWFESAFIKPGDLWQWLWSWWQHKHWYWLVLILHTPKGREVLQFRSTAYLKNLCPCFTKLNFLYMVPVAVAQFSSDNSAISYVFLVLWITSCFHIYITGICGVWHPICDCWVSGWQHRTAALKLHFSLHCFPLTDVWWRLWRRMSVSGKQCREKWSFSAAVLCCHPLTQQSQIGCLPYFYTWCGLSANLECRSEMCCTLLTRNTGRKNDAKNCHLGIIAQLCRAVSS